MTAAERSTRGTRGDDNDIIRFAHDNTANTVALNDDVLTSFWNASRRLGLDPNKFLDFIVIALDTTPFGGRLPQAEADYLTRFGGLREPEDGPGSDDFARLIAQTAASDFGNLLTTSEVAALLGIDVTRVRHRKASGDLISTKVGKNLRFPRWQLVQVGETVSLLPHLRMIRTAIRSDAHPAEVADLMTTPQPELMRRGIRVSPHDWLASGGDVAPVLEMLDTDPAW